jgi:hypothetical protein
MLWRWRRIQAGVHSATQRRGRTLNSIAWLMKARPEHLRKSGAESRQIATTPISSSVEGCLVARSPLPGRVPDETIKHLERFVTGPIEHETAVLPFPTNPTHSTRVGAA